MDFINEFNKGITVPIVIMCIVSLVLSAIVILRATKQKSSPQFMTDSFLLLGLLSLSYPIFWVIYALNSTAIAVNEGGAEMSVSLAWKGIGCYSYKNNSSAFNAPPGGGRSLICR